MSCALSYGERKRTWTRVTKGCAGITERANWGRWCAALIALLFISRVLWGLVASVKTIQLWNSKMGVVTYGKELAESSNTVKSRKQLPSQLGALCWFEQPLLETPQWGPCLRSLHQETSTLMGLQQEANPCSSARTAFPWPVRFLFLTLRLPLAAAACPELWLHLGCATGNTWMKQQGHQLGCRLWINWINTQTTTPWHLRALWSLRATSLRS